MNAVRWCRALSTCPSQFTTFKPEPKRVGYIYLIREREFVRMDENVYKVGHTIQEVSQRIRRVYDYKKNSELHLVMRCDAEKVKDKERAILQVFRRQFEKHPDGNEYFIGDSDEMVSVICDQLTTGLSPTSSLGSVGHR